MRIRFSRNFEPLSVSIYRPSLTGAIATAGALRSIVQRRIAALSRTAPCLTISDKRLEAAASRSDIAVVLARGARLTLDDVSELFSWGAFERCKLDVLWCRADLQDCSLGKEEVRSEEDEDDGELHVSGFRNRAGWIAACWMDEDIRVENQRLLYPLRTPNSRNAPPSLPVEPYIRSFLHLETNTPRFNRGSERTRSGPTDAQL